MKGVIIIDPIDILWNSINKLSSWGVDRTTKQIDKLLGIADPASAGTASGAAAGVAAGTAGTNSAANWSPPAWTPPLPPWAQGSATGATATVIGPEAHGSAQPAPGTPTTSSVQTLAPAASSPILTAAPTLSYSQDVADGIACTSCTRDHLVTMFGSAQAAAESWQRGDQGQTRYHLARMKAESTALLWYDWTPEKIARTPAATLKPVLAVQDSLMTLHRSLPTPEIVAGAWGSFDEAIRFAASDPQTDRDREEIDLRLQRGMVAIGTLERNVLAPEQVDRPGSGIDPQTADQIRKWLRKTRHTLDEGSPYSVATMTAMSTATSQAAILLTPEPTGTLVQQIEIQTKATYEQFFAEYLQYLRASAHHGEADRA